MLGQLWRIDRLGICSTKIRDDLDYTIGFGAAIPGLAALVGKVPESATNSGGRESARIDSASDQSNELRLAALAGQRGGEDAPTAEPPSQAKCLSAATAMVSPRSWTKCPASSITSGGGQPLIWVANARM